MTVNFTHLDGARVQIPTCRRVVAASKRRLAGKPAPRSMTCEPCACRSQCSAALPRRA
jgi:hypothetical protein